MPPRILQIRKGPASQRGAIVIAASMAVLVCVALLASADVGYLFYMKREFQKSADLAALAGAQILPNPCASGAGLSPSSAATASATENLRAHNLSSQPTITVNCGIWSGAAPSAPVGSSGGQYFAAGGAAASANAVQVLISGNAPAFLPFISDRLVRAGAVAVRDQPTAVISTGTQLASLKMAGLSASVMSAEGTARITLDGLLGRLGIKVDADIGVGELNALLAANKVSVGSLIDASASALPSSGAALSAQLGALKQSLNANGALNAYQVQLGGANSPIGLFTGIGAAATQDSAALARAALHTELKVSDLVSTAISIANARNAISISDLTLPGMRAQAAIVSPPSVAAGPVGTTARQAQVRVAIDLDTDKVVGGLLGSLLGARVHLPLFIDVARGTARINAISCDTKPPTVDVLVNQSVLGACVGKVAPTTEFAAAGLCELPPSAELQPEVLLKLPGVTPAPKTLQFDALPATELMMRIAVSETRTSAPNNLAIGNTLSSLVGTLMSTQAPLTSNTPPANVSKAQVAKDTAAQYLAQTPKNALGRYDIDELIRLLENGKSNSVPPLPPLPALGAWPMPVPYPCGLLNLDTCYASGTVWGSFKATVTGAGSGLLGGALGTVLGGLVVKNCYGLVATLLSYNTCIADNLTSYLQTKPEDAPCTSVYCTVFKPSTTSTTGLSSLLNKIGSSLFTALSSTLGLNLGQTGVTVHAISCGNVRLVH